ncbi:MAG: Uma2 family endonuclease [Magnetospirillum sp. WYHS-4]
MAQAALKQPSHMTVEEFLAWDDGTDTRYELVGGEVFAMAPPTASHGTVAANLAITVGGRLRRPCRIISEAGILLPANVDTYYQADLMITCAAPTPGERIASNPLVILEVLSPSTSTYDRGAKLPDYRSIPSVQEIVLISSTAMRAEIWHRTSEGWAVSDANGSEAILRLTSVDIEVPLEAVYEGVAFETEMKAG